MGDKSRVGKEVIDFRSFFLTSNDAGGLDGQVVFRFSSIWHRGARNYSGAPRLVPDMACIIEMGGVDRQRDAELLAVPFQVGGGEDQAPQPLLFG